MNPVEISSIPYHEIADGLSATTHSRRMTGVLLALFPEIGERAAIASKCMSPEFAEPLVDGGDDYIQVEIARRGLLPLHRVSQYVHGG